MSEQGKKDDLSFKAGIVAEQLMTGQPISVASLIAIGIVNELELNMLIHSWFRAKGVDETVSDGACRNPINEVLSATICLPKEVCELILAPRILPPE